jgi:hydroxyacylglutathione hydrolase
VPALVPIGAFADNYIWLLRSEARAWVVDPGDATGVVSYLDEHGLRLEGILLTHHHADHTGGVEALLSRGPARVYGPARERLPEPALGLEEGDQIDVFGKTFRVFEVPGHTLGHVAYYSDDFGGRPLLFCGDTLFSAGCGRLFEGSAAQMLTSLDRLARLPADTVVCCAHEYTLGNHRFARVVEPGNRDVAQHLERCIALRDRGEATLPSSIAQELRINPFLRSREPSVRHAVQRRGAGPTLDDVAAFAALRTWKDGFA